MSRHGRPIEAGKGSESAYISSKYGYNRSTDERLSYIVITLYVLPRIIERCMHY